MTLCKYFITNFDISLLSFIYLSIKLWIIESCNFFFASDSDGSSVRTKVVDYGWHSFNPTPPISLPVVNNVPSVFLIFYASVEMFLLHTHKN